uniref:Uncharacterized protein n=1 Tax=Fagus sylvatica TaxID=28930 RepID=A0A2N9GK02_FAGSY
MGCSKLHCADPASTCSYSASEQSVSPWSDQSRLPQSAPSQPDLLSLCLDLLFGTDLSRLPRSAPSQPDLLSLCLDLLSLYFDLLFGTDLFCLGLYQLCLGLERSALLGLKQSAPVLPQTCF